MLSRATFPPPPHLQPIWSQISLHGALANTDHRGITHTKWPQDCLRSSFLRLAVNWVGLETRVSQYWKASRDQRLIVIWVYSESSYIHRENLTSESFQPMRMRLDKWTSFAETMEAAPKWFLQWTRKANESLFHMATGVSKMCKIYYWHLQFHCSYAIAFVAIETILIMRLLIIPNYLGD